MRKEGLNMQIGAQLYTARNTCQTLEDFAETLTFYFFKKNPFISIPANWSSFF